MLLSAKPLAPQYFPVRVPKICNSISNVKAIEDNGMNHHPVQIGTHEGDQLHAIEKLLPYTSLVGSTDGRDLIIVKAANAAPIVGTRSTALAQLRLILNSFRINPLGST